MGRMLWLGALALALGCTDVSLTTVEQPVTTLAPGAACGCDADCAGTDEHPGRCVHGICMQQASSACSAGGSQAECPAGSRCWGYYSEPGYVCWPDCNAYSCDGTCDSDGSCAPTAQSATGCELSCSRYCGCQTDDDCESAQICSEGECLPSMVGPGEGPGPACEDLPAKTCTANCSQLTSLSPRVTAHYDDYPENGETWDNQYRSYMRRDLAMLVDHATALTHCKSAGWDTGIGGPLGMGDASEANGAIPGTSDNDPGHPSGSHVNGRDIDIAYYQIGTADNHLRPVCDHHSWGQNKSHCTGQPDTLDVWRSAFFIGALLSSPRVRVIGVDGKIGPLVESAMAKLCDDGWLPASACLDGRMTYETTNNGYGWYFHHHHHLHLSLKNSAGLAKEHRCIGKGCAPQRVKPHPLRGRRY